MAPLSHGAGFVAADTEAASDVQYCITDFGREAGPAWLY
jgi:hypothetical protein